MASLSDVDNNGFDVPTPIEEDDNNGDNEPNEPQTSSPGTTHDSHVIKSNDKAQTETNKTIGALTGQLQSVITELVRKSSTISGCTASVIRLEMENERLSVENDELRAALITERSQSVSRRNSDVQQLTKMEALERELADKDGEIEQIKRDSNVKINELRDQVKGALRLSIGIPAFTEESSLEPSIITEQMSQLTEQQAEIQTLTQEIQRMKEEQMKITLDGQQIMEQLMDEVAEKDEEIVRLSRRQSLSEQAVQANEMLMGQVEEGEKRFKEMMEAVLREKKSLHQRYSQRIKQLEKYQKNKRDCHNGKVAELQDAVENVKNEMEKLKIREQNERLALQHEFNSVVESLKESGRNGQALKAQAEHKEMEYEELIVANQQLMTNVDSLGTENFELKDTIHEIKKETKRLLEIHLHL